jgi:hypothetical protein
VISLNSAVGFGLSQWLGLARFAAETRAQSVVLVAGLVSSFDAGSVSGWFGRNPILQPTRGVVGHAEARKIHHHMTAIGEDWVIVLVTLHFLLAPKTISGNKFTMADSRGSGSPPDLPAELWMYIHPSAKQSRHCETQSQRS